MEPHPVNKTWPYLALRSGSSLERVRSDVYINGIRAMASCLSAGALTLASAVPGDMPLGQSILCFLVWVLLAYITNPLK